MNGAFDFKTISRILLLLVITFSILLFIPSNAYADLGGGYVYIRQVEISRIKYQLSELEKTHAKNTFILYFALSSLVLLSLMLWAYILLMNQNKQPENESGKDNKNSETGSGKKDG